MYKADALKQLNEDVTSLYTNIKHKAGIRAVNSFLEGESNFWIDYRTFLIDLLQFFLTHNYFVFNDKYYLQVQGTAMGVTYANVFLGWWEQFYVFSENTDQWTCHINQWLRYSDDLLIIWEGLVESLQQFFDVLNDNNLNLYVYEMYIVPNK
ncbi:hypothetical protein XELAEV_18031237mg [Xenopus laevis]|uniref:Reverse transcriptase domain-containing protein n=1 Tax=Xenopus laevis TaxID=8355 RepID=A0A974CM88_XENLA|nr:hypothetical protein XELAEV_18031237mg [Xenopus laevis]